MGIIPLFWPSEWDVNEVRTNVMAKCMSTRQKLQEFGWPSSVLPTTSGSENQAFGDHAFGGPCPEGREVQVTPESWFGMPRTPSYLSFFSVIAGMRLRQERTDTFQCPGQGTRYKDKVHTGSCVPDPGYWLRPAKFHAHFKRENRRTI